MEASYGSLNAIKLIRNQKDWNLAIIVILVRPIFRYKKKCLVFKNLVGITIFRRFMLNATKGISEIVSKKPKIWDIEIFSNYVSSNVNLPLTKTPNKLNGVGAELMLLPRRINEMIDNNINIKKAIMYTITRVEYELNNKKIINFAKNNFVLFEDKTRNGLTTAAFAISQSEIKPFVNLMQSRKLVNKITTAQPNQEHYTGLLNYFTDDSYPLTPKMIIATLDRMGVSYNNTRGFTANIMAECLRRQSCQKDTNNILSYLRIEKPEEVTTLNFALEFMVSYKHISYIQKHNQCEKLIYYTLTTKNISNSPQQKLSTLFTGQPNQDIITSYQIAINTEITMHLDIKDREFDWNYDIKRCYLRIAYNIEGFQDDRSTIETYLTYAQKHLKRYLNDEDTKYIHKVLINAHIDNMTKLNELNKYILHNSSTKPHARMLTLLYENRTVGSSHKNVMDIIPNADVADIDSTLFDIKDKTSRKFKEAYGIFSSKESHARMIKLIKDFDKPSSPKIEEILDLDG